MDSFGERGASTFKAQGQPQKQAAESEKPTSTGSRPGENKAKAAALEGLDESEAMRSRLTVRPYASRESLPPVALPSPRFVLAWSDETRDDIHACDGSAGVRRWGSELRGTASCPCRARRHWRGSDGDDDRAGCLRARSAPPRTVGAVKRRSSARAECAACRGHLLLQGGAAAMLCGTIVCANVCVCARVCICPCPPMKTSPLPVGAHG